MALTPEQAPFDTDKNGVLEGSEMQAYTASVIESAMSINKTNNNKSGTEVSTKKTKLTVESARALMEIAAQAADYTGKFTSADVTQFMKDFDAEQARQIEKVITSTSQKLTPGGTIEGAVDKTAATTATTEFPSFFNPTQFVQDWVWKKVSFDNEATLGSKSLAVLSQVRGLIEKFQLIGVSDQEAKNAAYSIAKGDKTLDDYTVELQQKAVIEYPQFADRFKANPKLTTYDIASPIINMIAETLEKDPKTIKMNHPIVLAYTRAAGADGKGQTPSYYDLLLKTKQLPEYQETQQANNEARDGATSLAKSLGFGLGA